MAVLGEFGKSLVLYKMKSRRPLRYSSRHIFDCRKGTVDGDKGLPIAQIAADIRCNLIRRAWSQMLSLDIGELVVCVCFYYVLAVTHRSCCMHE